MDSPTPEQNARITISHEDAQKFLERLANDDDFRAELEKNPGEVLRDHGIEIDPKNLPETVKLPPKDEIEAYLAPTRTRQAGGVHGWLGFAILYYVLGAMPLVVAEDDGSG
jgi:putative modified peptide